MATPPTPARATKKQRDELRARLLAAGASHRVIKDEMIRLWGLRPRRAWRYAHGWSQSTTAVRYNELHDLTGQAPMSETRIGAYERWPDSKERPSLQILHGLAELFGTTMEQVIDGYDLQHMPTGERRALQESATTSSPPAVPDTPTAQITAYREWDELDTADGSIDQHGVVVMAAHEGSEHAEHAERRDIGEATLEQLRADVIRLSHDHMTGDPFTVFREMRRVRFRIYAALDRRLWPRDQAELYFLLGLLSALMAAAANGLGNRQAAEELVRAGWAYAVAIDHHPLMAQLRLELANIIFWQRPRHSRDLARRGLDYLSNGPNAAQLHLRYGRAAARLGDGDTARQAIIAAHQARDRDHHDDVLEIGGEFGLSRATQHFLAGSTLIEIPDATQEAIPELEQAANLYSAGPAPGEDHYYGYVACTNIDLATARLRTGQLDAATSALEPVLSLPSDRRIEALLRRFDRVRVELAATRYRHEPLADDLDQAIETFTTETIVADLAELPPGSHP